MGNMREEDVEIFGPVDQMRVVARKILWEWEGVDWNFGWFKFAVSNAAGKGLLEYRAESCHVPDVEHYLKDYPELQANVHGTDIDNNRPYAFEVRNGKYVFDLDNDYKICNAVQPLLKKLQELEAIKSDPALVDEVRGILQRIYRVRHPPKFELGEDARDEINTGEGIFGGEDGAKER